MKALDRRCAAVLVAAAALWAPQASARPDMELDAVAARTSLAGNYLAGRVAGAQRDAEAAATFFRAALRADPRNPELLERAFLLSVAEGDQRESMRLAERVVAADSSNRMAQLALATKALKAGAYARARGHLARSARGPLADLTISLLTAWSWLGADQPARALETIDRLQGADFFGTFRDYHGALIADLAGRRAEASRRYNAAIASDGAALRVSQAAASFYTRIGDRENALKALADLEKSAPRHPLARAAREAIEGGREPERPIASVAEGVAETLYGIGGALGRQGGEDLSIVYLQLALFVAPDHPMALVTLADLYDQLNQYAQAVTVYERVPAASPLKRNAEIQRAIDLDRLDRTDEAKAELTKLIEASPDDQEAIVALGNIERGREQFVEAAETYTRAIALIGKRPPEPAPAPVVPVTAPPKSGSYVVQKGDTFWTLARDRLGDGERWTELVALNRTPEAEQANGRRLSRDNALSPGQTIQLPGAAPAPVEPKAAEPAPVEPKPVEVAAEPAKPTRADWSLFYVRGIAYERSKQWPKSEADLKQALELYPDQPLVLNYLGYSWIDQGINLDEGMKMIRRAVELRPDDGYIVDSLGWAHFKLGKYDDAVRELERAVELRPQDPVMNDHLGDAYWKVGRKLEAGFQWSHARDLKPEPDDLKKIEAKLKNGLPDAPATNAADGEGEKKPNGG